MKRVIRFGVLIGTVMVVDNMLSRMYANDPKTWVRACNSEKLERLLERERLS